MRVIWRAHRGAARISEKNPLTGVLFLQIKGNYD